MCLPENPTYDPELFYAITSLQRISLEVAQHYLDGKNSSVVHCTIYLQMKMQQQPEQLEKL